MLGSRRGNHVRQAGITNYAIGRQAHSAGRSDDAAAPVAEDVAVGGDRYGRAGGQVIGHDDVGRPGEMGAQDHDYGCGLWEVVNQFVADTNLHPTSPDLTVPAIAAAASTPAERDR